MLRLGFFTGSIYTEEDFKSNKIHECCLVLPKDIKNDPEKLEEIRKKYRKKCNRCLGCPTSKPTLIVPTINSTGVDIFG